MSGKEKLESWLDTKVYECHFRPVPLTEYILCDSKLMNKQQEALLTLPRPEGKSDHIPLITSLYCAKNKQILIFCASKNACEETAIKRAEKVPI